jgi:hypothetical protein
MNDWSRALFLAGSLPFLLLGAAHALATPRHRDDRKGLLPRDPRLPEAMAGSAVLLTSRTDVWRAWIGFNFSHSLGALTFGALVLLAGRSPESFALEASWFIPASILVSGAYLALGVRYWFRTPIVGIGLGLAAFVASGLLRLAVT